MADNVTLPGTGEIVATEDTGGAEYQKIKLVDGEATSTTMVGVGVGAAGNGLRVSFATGSTVAATQSGNWSSRTQDGSGNNIDSANFTSTTGLTGGVSALAVNAACMMWDPGNSEWRTIHGDQTNGIRADVRGDALTALQLIDNTIVAAGAAISGATGVNVVGLRGETTDPAVVDAADAVQALATLTGKQVTQPHALPGESWQYAGVSGGITDTADDVAKAAVASTRNYVTELQVINGHATVSTEVVVKDGATVIWRGWAQAAGGGCSAKFATPLRGSVNTAINVAAITTGSKIYFNLQGFESAE